MTLPLSVRELESFLPHRGSAIWIDEVIAVDAHSGTCRVNFKPDATYARGDSLLESTYLEWMAQSFGYVTAAQLKLGLSKGNGELQDAFLAAVKNYEIFSLASQLSSGDSFEVHVKATHQVGPVTLVEGRIEKFGEVLAKANLKLFAVPK